MVVLYHILVISTNTSTTTRRTTMWTKPAATEMRFGFEVTLYVMNK
jgi:pyrroloquinoline quinone biosynthesis protein A